MRISSYQLFANVRTRVAVWLDVFHYTDGVGYQVSQSLFGLGTGGMFGTGLGVGHPEIVPLPATDFILTSFGEELGLFGLVALLVIYVLFVERGFAAGLAVRDAFGKLLATGLSFLIGLQLFVVAAGVTRLLPRDRADHAVPVLRRLVAAGQLRAARAPAAYLRRCPPAVAAAAGRRRPRHRARLRWCRHEQAHPSGGHRGRRAHGRAVRATSTSSRWSRATTIATTRPIAG